MFQLNVNVFIHISFYTFSLNPLIFVKDYKYIFLIFSIYLYLFLHFYNIFYVFNIFIYFISYFFHLFLIFLSFFQFYIDNIEICPYLCSL